MRRLPGQRRARVALLAIIISAAPDSVRPAVAQPSAAVQEADRLRNDGRLTEAVDLLRDHLVRVPQDGEAARLLAQTLYWLRDTNAARQVYDDALRRHPRDTTLQLQYGRFLVETDARGRARELLAPLAESAESPAARAEALALLGLLAYWQGDLTTARHRFRETLTHAPSHAEAGRLLAEIEAAAAPWVRVSGMARHDDQPLDRMGVGVEAGWFATPLIPFVVRAEPLAFKLPSGRSERLWSTEAEVRGYVPASRVEFEAAGGLVRRERDLDPISWRGRAGLGLRAGSSVALRGRVERRPYLNTTASLTTPVTVTAATGLVALDHRRGWLGEAGANWQRFPDDNLVRTAYAWLLAPLVYNSRGELRAGYAWAGATADESRFVLATPNQSVPPSDPAFDFAGRYVPYYTPDRQTTHSVTAAAAFHGGSGKSLRISGARAIRATEQVPLLYAEGDLVGRLSYPRTYRPWTATARFTTNAGSRVAVDTSVEVGRTAFYRWVSGEAHVTYKFIGRSPRAKP